MTHIYKHPEVIKQMEKDYPHMTSEFQQICAEMYETFCLKQFNYGPTNISVGTSLAKPEEVKLSLTGIWFRMQDKMNRLKQLVLLGNKDVVGESTQDTYQDLSVYGIIGQIVIRGKWAK